jgi:hypothetical protein
LTESRHTAAAKVSAKDRALVEWVAGASVGDTIPQPWCYASRPLESIVRTLATLGVIERAPQGSDWAAIARTAGPHARAWLERNPPAGGGGAAT